AIKRGIIHDRRFPGICFRFVYRRTQADVVAGTGRRAARPGDQLWPPGATGRPRAGRAVGRTLARATAGGYRPALAPGVEQPGPIVIAGGQPVRAGTISATHRRRCHHSQPAGEHGPLWLARSAYWRQVTTP